MTDQRYVALLRGVNVGGGNRVPMAELRAMAAGFGWRDVASYIASGNLVFTANGATESLAERLAAGLRRDMGVDVPVLVLTHAALAAALADCPFPPDAGKAVHGVLCWGIPALNADRLAELAAPTERLDVRGDVVWMHAPDGFGTSKLAEKIDKVILGTTYTARNLNTIVKLVDMSRDPG